MVRLVRKRMTVRKLKTFLDDGNESDTLDFKRTLKLGSTREKYEFLKDVAAFSNAYGGYIVIGVEDDDMGVGSPAKIDLADIHNVVESFFAFPLGIDYRQFDLEDGNTYGLLYIPSVSDRIVVMPRNGGYHDGTQTRSVFSQGDVYFRRGSRSIKACAEDFDFMMAKREVSRVENVEEADKPERKIRSGKGRSVTSLARYWRRLSNGSTTLSVAGKASVARFLHRLTGEEIKKAMEIAFSKGLADYESTFRYFCGVAHNMADQSSGDSNRGKLRQARAYFRSKRRGSGYFADDEFLKYAKRFDLTRLKEAIDETFSERRTNYFRALCEILDGQVDVQARHQELLDCRFCEGTGAEPPTCEDDDQNPIPCRICRGKGVILVEADSDVVPCKICGASGKQCEDGYFYGDACAACSGLGYQALVGSVNMPT